jgi:hypothetical protein
MYGFGFGFGFKSNGINVGATVFKAYKARVEADGGTVENDACAIAFLNNLNSINIPVYLLLGDTGFILQEDSGKIIL